MIDANMPEDNLLLGTGRRNAFSTIDRCCDEAKAQGIQIIRGPLFHWGSDERQPIACDGLGAVLWCLKGDRTKPWTSLGQSLKVDPFWLYRFCIGWDNWHQIVVHVKDPNVDGDRWIQRPDEVSKMAIKLSKEKTR